MKSHALLSWVRLERCSSCMAASGEWLHGPDGVVYGPCDWFSTSGCWVHGHRFSTPLLDHMLCPDGELERPDLMLIIIHHWLDLQCSTRSGGSITISAYVTLIADRLEVPTDDDELCRGLRLLDAEAFRLAKFIKIEKGAAGHRDIYHWCMPDNGIRYQMPFHAPLSFEDRSTWFFTRPGATQVPPPPPPMADEPMPDAPGSTPQAHASTSGTGPSRSTGHTLDDIYHLMTAMRATQLRQGEDLYAIRHELHDQSRRMTAIEDEMRDWRFYDQHEDFPGSSSPHD